jgi:hypothetical protein
MCVYLRLSSWVLGQRHVGPCVWLACGLSVDEYALGFLLTRCCRARCRAAALGMASRDLAWVESELMKITVEVLYTYKRTCSSSSSPAQVWQSSSLSARSPALPSLPPMKQPQCALVSCCCVRHHRGRMRSCLQLILPESLKYLPLSISSALKLDAFALNSKPTVGRLVWCTHCCGLLRVALRCVALRCVALRCVGGFEA